MKIRISILMSFVFLLFVAQAACGDDDDDDDDADECHELGVPFEPPAGVTTTSQLPEGTCCDHGAATIAEEMTDDQCVALDPLQFVCISYDGECNNGETFCTEPIKCEPPTGFAEACCGEGDLCWSKDAGGYPSSGVIGCCAGLTEIREYGRDADSGECVPSSSETNVICVRECGDGECTAGEWFCNCPEDCPADE